LFDSLRTGESSINMARKVQLELGFILGVVALWLSLRGARLADGILATSVTAGPENWVKIKLPIHAIIP
jgi:hypothetical protein